MNTPQIKPVINTLYEGAVVSALSIGFSMLLERFTKTKVSISKLGLKEFAMLTAVVTSSVATKEALERNGIIPSDPYQPQ